MQPALLSWESGSGGKQEGVHRRWGCSGKRVGQQGEHQRCQGNGLERTMVHISEGWALGNKCKNHGS